MLWDRGYWEPSPVSTRRRQGAEEGRAEVRLDGERLHGSFVLVRMKRREREASDNWLLIKHHDGLELGGATSSAGRPRWPRAEHGRDRRRQGQGPQAVHDLARSAKAGAADAVWQSQPRRKEAVRPPAPRRAAKKAARRPRQRSLKVAALPGFVRRSSASRSTGRRRAPAGPRDQVRRLPHAAARRGGKATLKTRKGLDWTGQVRGDRQGRPSPADGMIDGEVVRARPQRRARLPGLQAALSDGKTDDLIFFAFDLLFAGGEDLRNLPLRERKARLKALLGRPRRQCAPLRRPLRDRRRRGAAVGLPDGAGGHRLQEARRALPLGPRRDLDQVQVPGRPRGGDRRLDRRGAAFRSLIAGVHRDGKLVHVGRVGTGFGRDKVARCCRS
jgi:bifunctional non-homologous end joining protein LigD